MTGAQPLPENMGAVIYMGWPPFTNWIYLGYLSNKKPSAIFKVQPVSVNTIFFKEKNLPALQKQF
jgi:hypothetical protein